MKHRSKQITITLIILLAVVGLVPSCGSSSKPQVTSKPTVEEALPSEPIKATWVDIQVDGDNISISVIEVRNKKLVHFLLGKALSGDIVFMAYELDRKIYVRSNVCPPCLSVGFSLQKDVLVCDRCATTFKAKTGDGIKGACVAFPKASVPYEIRDDTIIMKRNDLITAYQNTLKPGWP